MKGRGRPALIENSVRKVLEEWTDYAFALGDIAKLCYDVEEPSRSQMVTTGKVLGKLLQDSIDWVAEPTQAAGAPLVIHCLASPYSRLMAILMKRADPARAAVLRGDPDGEKVLNSFDRKRPLEVRRRLVARELEDASMTQERAIAALAKPRPGSGWKWLYERQAGLAERHVERRPRLVGLTPAERLKMAADEEWDHRIEREIKSLMGPAYELRLAGWGHEDIHEVLEAAQKAGEMARLAVITKAVKRSRALRLMEAAASRCSDAA